MDVPVQLFPVLNRVQELPVCWRVVVLEVGLDRLVLLVELGQIGDEILDNVHWRALSARITEARIYAYELRTVRERVDLGVFGGVPVNPAQARQRVLAVDVHGARAADTLSA